jgi:hypothetical protein
VRYRAFRRRMSEATAVFGFLDVVTLAVGLALFALAAVCAWATVTVIAHWRDAELGFPYGDNVARGVKVLALLLFPALGIALLAAAWAMAGDHVHRLWRRLRRSGSS